MYNEILFYCHFDYKIIYFEYENLCFNKKNYLPRFTLTKIQQFKDSGICFGRYLDFDPLK